MPGSPDGLGDALTMSSLMTIRGRGISATQEGNPQPLQ